MHCSGGAYDEWSGIAGFVVVMAKNGAWRRRAAPWVAGRGKALARRKWVACFPVLRGLLGRT